MCAHKIEKSIGTTVQQKVNLGIWKMQNLLHTLILKSIFHLFHESNFAKTFALSLSLIIDFLFSNTHAHISFFLKEKKRKFHLYNGFFSLSARIFVSFFTKLCVQISKPTAFNCILCDHIFTNKICTSMKWKAKKDPSTIVVGICRRKNIIIKWIIYAADLSLTGRNCKFFSC